MWTKRVLLIVGGGIAAYKACELIRLIRKAGGSVRCVLTTSGAEFVTPMTLAALSEQPVHTSLWDLKDEVEMGHIQLSREADLVLVCPATADLLAKMAAGIADDLATTLLLATDKSVYAAPAMNVRMWQHSATRRNVARLRSDGIQILEPDEGEMACGEFGPGRLPEPEAILAWLQGASAGPLTGRHIIVTAGPTQEPIDPVRMIANRSSGKQGFAVAEALADLGARITLVAGPVALATPAGVERIDVETAQQMRDAVWNALPADAAVLVAAVSDWRTDYSGAKIKKSEAGPPTLTFVENPDILAELAASPERPKLLVGFAAETEKVVEQASAKRIRKGCDWIVANGVAGDVMGSDRNLVHVIDGDGTESWPEMSKREVAERIAERIAAALSERV
jgi:phosphopantothenoylcysteine decarboxylase / phosphopantothenate---cysteine ligase